jgi:hypothetical protein
MAQASMYVEQMIQYWGNLGRMFTTRIQNASRDARKGTYGLDRMLSDAVALWTEGFEAWCAAWLGRGGPAPAIVFLRVPRDTEFKLRVVPVPIPGDAPAERTDLVCVNAPGARIPRDHVKVKLSEFRDELTVELINLTPILPALPEGQYLGLVYVDERPIAVIHALVSR